jgi:hypothetical protein
LGTLATCSLALWTTTSRCFITRAQREHNDERFYWFLYCFKSGGIMFFLVFFNCFDFFRNRDSCKVVYVEIVEALLLPGSSVVDHGAVLFFIFKL